MKSITKAFSITGLATIILFISSPALTDMTLGIGAGLRSFNYQEVLTPPLKSTQSGILTDARAYAVEKTSDHGWFATEKVEFAWGTLEYDGSTQPPNVVPATSEDLHTFWVFEGEGGRQLFTIFSDSTDVYLYAGLSYRIWNRNLPNPQEIYKLLSVPVGLRFEPVHKEPFSIGLDLSVRPLISGNVSVTYAPSTGYDPQTVPVSYAVGFRAELPIRLVGGDSGGLNFTPWFESSDIGQGSAVPITAGGQPVTQNGQPLGALEPSSHTVQYGAYLSMDFGI